ncbi:MAG: class I SAM-dependent methyltransferase [Candidatus Omnitrophica bacterium]|nr:class I SAM-dependent methyltransferase [Candidatus Omnitrophota bacterium]
MKSDSQRSFHEARHPEREKGRDLFLSGFFIEELRSLVPNPKRILVLGSGDGKESRALIEHFPEVSVLSMDLSAPEIESSASVESLRGALVRGDWDLPPFAAETFDLAVFFAALHHSARLEKTLRSVSSILRPGGALYATHEPMASLLLGRSQKARMANIAEEEGGIETSPSLGEYQQALEKAGFTSFRVGASSLNLIRLEANEPSFADVRLRRSAWPERFSATCLKAITRFDKNAKLSFLFLLQRLAFGLFGVTITGKKE